ncbi:hypothetical protein ZIOFF_070704 [Zingiber officinale]|uniref:Uncharacterized protein n=1 Tax=Zingiber officinale TaxID=94328 RepID=A0A8J5EQ24_ZINOF|nr:hypothetical protein ZIOFF_070704 [Zingiber officinale]
MLFCLRAHILPGTSGLFDQRRVPLLGVSCRFLQSSEFALWHTDRILYTRELSDNDCRAKWKGKGGGLLSVKGLDNPWYEYRWADGVQIKKPIEVSAPKYVEYLMEWIEVQLDDESIFPQKLGTPFPPNFKDVVKTIFKRLFRVYAHIYHSHFQKIVSLKEEAHLNTCFKHFILFTYEFGLIDKKELAPLQELIESIIVPY